MDILKRLDPLIQLNYARGLYSRGHFSEEAIKILRKNKMPRIGTGAFRQVYRVSSHWVVKIDRDFREVRAYLSQTEAKIYQRWYRYPWKSLFCTIRLAETYLVAPNMVIQEYIPRCRGPRPEQWVQQAIQWYAEEIGICDMHSGNWRWNGHNREGILMDVASLERNR